MYMYNKGSIRSFLAKHFKWFTLEKQNIISNSLLMQYALININIYMFIWFG